MKGHSLPGLLWLLLTVALMAALLAGCVNTLSNPTLNPSPSETMITPADHPARPSRGFFMGILPTPSEGDSFADTYEKASALAEFVPIWGRPTPFYGLAQELSGSWGHTFVDQYIRGNGMFPIINLSFIGADMALVTPPGIQGATLENPEWRKAYTQAALEAVKAAKPLYLSLGNEVNRWYERYGARDGDPNGFQNYVTLYNEIYDAVKRLSPQTIVFCIFAREIVVENREADLTVLRMFNADKLDMLVFTSYPNAVRGIRRPENIPGDYYAKALKYISEKPFGLSEAGWAALDAFGGEQSQADFITQVMGRLTVEQGINLQLLGWPWLSALDEKDPVALVKRDGDQRLAYGVWVSLFSPRK